MYKDPFNFDAFKGGVSFKDLRFPRRHPSGVSDDTFEDTFVARILEVPGVHTSIL